MSDVTKGGAEFDRDRVYPVLPLRDIVVFPGMIVPLFVGREKSVKALEEVMRDDKHILVVTQKNAQDDDPSPDQIYATGTIASVLQLLKLPDGTVKVLVEGLHRASIDRYLQTVDYFEAEATVLVEPETDAVEIEALARSAQTEFESYVKLNKKISAEVVTAVGQIEDYSKLADTIASHLVIKINEKEDLLSTISPAERLQKILGLMEGEIGVLQVEKRIRSRVKRQMEKTQREYYLNEQMKAIQRELGDGEEGSNELAELEEKIAKTKLSKEARQKADAELKKLKAMSPMSAEATVVRNYLDWLLSLPWGKKSKVKRDLNFAQKVLDEDHYGLEKVKERIVEYLAVLQRVEKIKGPILCLVGPPGVGKTSLGRSIARSLGRKFVRISLGGVHDEAEIRGHRRTYIGSLPGQIIRGLRQVDSNDPVFMLDEVDKLGQHVRGDPAAALLEVLDPEQNATFRDHYLDVPFDLSRVLFIATANVLDPVPAALRDRMETIQLPGYVDEEKLHIARRYLIPKQAVENGIELEHHIRFGDDAIATLINGYTHEAGVRTLERRLGAICRKRARQLVADGGDAMLTQPSTSIGAESEALEVTPEVVRKLLGPPNFLIETQLAERVRCPGVAVALAWTPQGGDVLFVEVARMPRVQGEFLITGQIKDVMQESARTALSWIRSHAADYDIEADVFAHSDIHIHVPSGAVPKDGPSAGLVMVAALLSLLVQRPGRPFVAMTGEITLSGRVLAVGGLKQKILAAKRSGVREVVLPAENRDQVLDEVSPSLRQGLTLHFVDTIRDAVELALVPRSASPSRQREPQEQTRLPMPDEWHA